MQKYSVEDTPICFSRCSSLSSLSSADNVLDGQSHSENDLDSDSSLEILEMDEGDGEAEDMRREKEKAEMVYKGIADNALRSINWYFRLRPGQLSSVESDLGHNLAVLQEVLRVSKQYNPEFAKPYQEEFDNYRMAYGSVAKD